MTKTEERDTAAKLVERWQEARGAWYSRNFAKIIEDFAEWVINEKTHDRL